MTWRASVLTLFPEMFPGPLAHSLAGRALASGAWSLRAINIRDFAAEAFEGNGDGRSVSRNGNLLGHVQGALILALGKI